MLRTVLTAALLAGALAKGVAIGAALTGAGALCARKACRARRRSGEAEAETPEA